MRHLKASFSTLVALIISTIGAGQVLGAQARRIPLIYIDEWYTGRVLLFILVGVLWGLCEAAFFLPRLLPVPHENDNVRAINHCLRTLIWVVLTLVLILLIDLSVIYRFGNRHYEFLDTLIQVSLSWESFKLFSYATISYVSVLALWTRLSNRGYRYMIIRN